MPESVACQHKNDPDFTIIYCQLHQPSGVPSKRQNDMWAVGSYFSGDPLYPLHALIAHWDGTTWSAVASPQPEGGYELSAVAALSSTDVWAVGTYNLESDNLPQALIEHWDGSAWSIVANTTYGFLFGIAALASNDIWAVGNGAYNTLTLHWDGTAWSTIPNPAFGTLYSIAALSSGNVWAVGQYTTGTTEQTFTEHWDGTAWSVIPSGQAEWESGLYGVSTVSSSDVWAVGYSTPDGRHNHALTEHWDGTQWSIIPSYSAPSLPSHLIGVVALASDDVWAVGQDSALYKHQKIVRTLIEHWDGTGWQNSPSPAVGWQVTLNSIIQIPGARQLLTVGTYNNDAGYFQTLIEMYQ